MALKTKVLINQVNNLSDARYCAGMGVDYLGFNVEEGQSNYLAPEPFKEMTSWVSGPEFVGEFNNSNLEEIINISSTYSIKAVQVSNLELVKELHNLDYSVIVDLPSKSFNRELAETRSSFVSAFMLRLETYEEEELGRIASLAADFPIILGGDISTQHLESILEKPFQGIAMQGGDEVKPGYREFDEMADILELLELED